MCSNGPTNDITSLHGRNIKKKRCEDFDYSYFELKHPRLLKKSSMMLKHQNYDNNDSNTTAKGKI